MKKFFSFLCATLLVMSASAKPFPVKKAAAQAARPALTAVDAHVAIPAPKAVKKAPAVAAAFVNSYDVPLAQLVDYTQVANENWFQMMGNTADGAYIVSVCVNSDHLVGTFATADIDFQYTYIGEYATQQMLDIVEGSVTVSVSGDTTFLSADFVDADQVSYHVNMLSYIPDKSNMENIVMDLGGCDATYASYGLLVLYGMTNDQLNFITFGLWSEAADFSGSYTDGDFDAFLSEQILMVNDVELSILQAEFTVANDGTTVMVEGDFLADNGIWYHIILSFPAADLNGSSALEYDTEDAPFSANFSDVTVTPRSSDGINYATIVGKNANQTIGVYCFYAAADPTNVIPVGTYTFASDYSVGTAYASEGLDEQGYVVGSYAGILDADGYITDVWFMVDGTVTVTAGKAVVNAVNSYNQTITATLTWGAQAVENIAEGAAAEKALVDGKIVIVKNGKSFNLMGTAL